MLSESYQLNVLEVSEVNIGLKQHEQGFSWLNK